MKKEQLEITERLEREISIIKEETDMLESGIGYSLKMPEDFPRKSYYSSRIFASIGEAIIAKGIIVSMAEKYGKNIEFHRYQTLLEFGLLLVHSDKVYNQ